MSAQLHILVLEDEPRAGKKLIRMIEGKAPQANIAWCKGVAEGIAYLEANPQPDLIFSDIALIDGPAFQVFEAARPACPIIFCTAYDAFYVEAFRTNGIAYLLKPYNLEEFAAAWEKFEVLFLNHRATAAPDQLLDTLAALIQSPVRAGKTTFSVRKNEEVYLIKSQEIALFQATGDFVVAVDRAGKGHVLSYTLSELVQLLDASQFFQINRSEIINFDYLVKFEPYIKNRLAIHLLPPHAVVYTSNSRTPIFRAWLEAH